MPTHCKTCLMKTNCFFATKVHRQNYSEINLIKLDIKVCINNKDSSVDRAVVAEWVPTFKKKIRVSISNKSNKSGLFQNRIFLRVQISEIYCTLFCY